MGGVFSQGALVTQSTVSPRVISAAKGGVALQALERFWLGITHFVRFETC
jgi:hypothetical protein